MSFNFGPMQNLSNVQASHKSTPGGGGNTGYFQRGKKEEEEKAFNFETEEYPKDSFEITDLEIEEEESKDFKTIIKEFFAELVKIFKGLFSK